MNPSISAVIATLNIVLCAVQPSPAQADSMALPNRPPLLSPDEDRVFVGGLPPGERRVLKERIFSDGEVITSALCAENLMLQPIFPAGAPARGQGVWCLADLTVRGPQELTATVYLSGQLIGRSRQLVVHPDCRIFVEDGSMSVPGMDFNEYGETLQWHVLSCRSDRMARAAFGHFLSANLAPGDAYVAGSFAFGVEREFRDGGACGCDPVECDPCCATCPD